MLDRNRISIIPPTSQAEGVTRELVENLFQNEEKVEIVPFSKPQISLNSGGGSVGVQILEWVVSASQTGVWEWLAAFLSGYAGKEFLKGFSGEAGKDFWRAIKTLASKISSHPKLENRDKGKIRVVAQRAEGDPHFSLEFPPSWFGDCNNTLAVELLEVGMLPAVASFLDHNGARKNKEHTALSISIKSMKKPAIGWRMNISQRASRWEFEIWAFPEEKLLQWDTRDGKLDHMSKQLLDEIRSTTSFSVEEMDLFVRFKN